MEKSLEEQYPERFYKLCEMVLGRWNCPEERAKFYKEWEKSIMNKFPQLVDEWNYAENYPWMPWNFSYGSAERVSWKCRVCGHEWKAKINNRTMGRGCKKCFDERSTSFDEQVVFYYLNKITKAESRWRKWGKNREIDVYLPQLKIGVEYNGFWHAGKEGADIEKIEFFKKIGIRIFTIKQGQRNQVVGDTIELIYHQTNKTSLEWAIRELFKLLKLPVPLIDISADTIEILEQYISLKKKNSIVTTHPELAKEWHPTKNGTLEAENFTYGSNQMICWKCSLCGNEWDARIKHRSRGQCNCGVCYKKRRKQRKEKP